MRCSECGAKATPYRKDYGVKGWESGYRCKKCGRLRIPSPNLDMTPYHRYMITFDAIREAGIASDPVAR